MPGPGLKVSGRGGPGAGSAGPGQAEGGRPGVGAATPGVPGAPGAGVSGAEPCAGRAAGIGGESTSAESSRVPGGMDALRGGCSPGGWMLSGGMDAPRRDGCSLGGWMLPGRMLSLAAHGGLQPPALCLSSAPAMCALG